MESATTSTPTPLPKVLQKAIDDINHHNNTDAFLDPEYMSRSEYLAYKRALVLATEIIERSVQC